MPAGTTWDIGREFRIWDLELVRHLWFPGILIGKMQEAGRKNESLHEPGSAGEYAHSYRNKFQAELLTETEEMEERQALGHRK